MKCIKPRYYRYRISCKMNIKNNISSSCKWTEVTVILSNLKIILKATFFFNSIYACTKTNIINVKSKNYVVTHFIPPIFLLKNIIFFSKNFVISLFNSFTFSCYWDHGIIEWWYSEELVDAHHLISYAINFVAHHIIIKAF